MDDLPEADDFTDLDDLSEADEEHLITPPWPDQVEQAEEIEEPDDGLTDHLEFHTGPERIEHPAPRVPQREADRDIVRHPDSDERLLAAVWDGRGTTEIAAILDVAPDDVPRQLQARGLFSLWTAKEAVHREGGGAALSARQAAEATDLDRSMLSREERRTEMEALRIRAREQRRELEASEASEAERLGELWNFLAEREELAAASDHETRIPEANEAENKRW